MTHWQAAAGVTQCGRLWLNSAGACASTAGAQLPHL